MAKWGAGWEDLKELAESRETMETTDQLKSRFSRAFKLYADQDGELRRLRADLPERPDSAAIHNLNLQLRIVSEAERCYQAVRLEYVKRLLPGV